MADNKSFYDKYKLAESKLSKKDDQMARIISTHSSETYMKDKQIAILEQQLNNTKKNLKNMTISYNKSVEKIKNCAKKLDVVRLFVGEV